MPGDSKAKSMSWEDIQSRFPDEWVLLEVTRQSKTGRIWGRPLLHSADRSLITERVIEIGKTRPEVLLGIFFTGPLLDPDFDGVLVL